VPHRRLWPLGSHLTAPVRLAAARRLGVLRHPLLGHSPSPTLPKVGPGPRGQIRLYKRISGLGCRLRTAATYRAARQPRPLRPGSKCPQSPPGPPVRPAGGRRQPTRTPIAQAAANGGPTRPRRPGAPALAGGPPFAASAAGPPRCPGEPPLAAEPVPLGPGGVRPAGQRGRGVQGIVAFDAPGQVQPGAPPPWLACWACAAAGPVGPDSPWRWFPGSQWFSTSRVPPSTESERAGPPGTPLPLGPRGYRPVWTSVTRAGSPRLLPCSRGSRLSGLSAKNSG
jgi:hypothetical protein